MAEQEDAAVDRVRVVEGLAEVVPRGDWVTAFQDGTLQARLRSYLDEVAIAEIEIEGLVAGQAGFVAPVTGVDGLIEFWREWLAPWESFTLDVGRVLEGTRGVLLEVVQKGRLEGSTAVVRTLSAAVHYFRGDRLARIEFHIDREQAREAAGI
jgi:hypothetical protein